jgi:divalent metal cation (Fe/Co/Zn/Cd) transporter
MQKFCLTKQRGNFLRPRLNQFSFKSEKEYSFKSDKEKESSFKSEKHKVKLKTHESEKEDRSYEKNIKLPDKEMIEKNQKKAIFATKLGAVANVGLACSKGFIGFSIASTALIADAANSLGDVFSDAVVYYALKESRKRATPDRPWGRGKLEPLGALSVGGLLLATGVGIGYSAGLAAYDILINPFIDIPPEILLPLPPPAESQNPASVIDSVKNIDSKMLNNAAALFISGTSILAKEALFRYTL